MLRTALRTFLVTTRTWAIVGVALGAGLACVTAARNGFRSPADVLRLSLGLAALFGAVLLATGALAGVLVALLGRRVRRPAEAAFASAVATTGFFWVVRAFEFELAYPARWPFVHGFGGMLAFALVVAAAAAVAAVAVGAALYAIARSMRGFSWSRAATAVPAVTVLAALSFALHRPPATSTAGPALATHRPPAPSPAGSPPPGGALSLPPPNGRLVLLVGCDGADWHVIDALFAENELPVLRCLAAAGVRAPFRTLKDHPSPSLWTTIGSSRSPRETGIADFYVQTVFGASVPIAEFPRHFGLDGGLLLQDVLGKRAVRVTPVSSNMVRTRRLWSLLAGAGVSTGVVNWLVTWPARAEGAAFLVSDRAWTELRRARADRADSSSARRMVPSLCDPPGVAAQLPTEDGAWGTEDAFVSATTLRLFAGSHPQVLIAYFRDVDAAEHLSWDRWEPRFFRGRSGMRPHGGPVREAYRAFDRHLGALLEAVGPETTVLVVSDHGHHAWFTWLGRGTPGGHTDAPDGIFLAAGPGIRRPSGPFAPTVYDLTPTVLRLVGLPAASDMKGRELSEILTEGEPLPPLASYEAGERASGRPVESDMDEGMIERLRALGYVR
ncbi:MAG: alkaline phosphatase family protein [bacterium]